MAKVAEDMPRMAGDIMSGRQQRAELAMEIKRLTSSRRNEVRSALERWKASRMRVGRELAAEMDKITKTRHREVHAMLGGMKSSRSRASRERQKEAMATIGRRRNEMRALLARFKREMVAHRLHRLERVRLQRAEAANFMRDLTSKVSGMLGGFVRDDRNRAATMRERLTSYARERHAAIAAWHGMLQPQAGSQRSEAGHHRMATPPAEEAGTRSTPAPEMASPSSRRQSGHGHGSSSERHGGSK